MRLIVLDPSNPQSDFLYNALDNLFYFLAEKLPKLFLHTINYNGEVLQIPRMITQRHYNSLDKNTRELFNELWDLVLIGNTK